MRKLPEGYWIKHVNCTEMYDHDKYLLYYNNVFITSGCAFMAFSWWVVWRLRSKARAFARHGIVHSANYRY